MDTAAATVIVGYYIDKDDPERHKNTHIITSHCQHQSNPQWSVIIMKWNAVDIQLSSEIKLQNVTGDNATIVKPDTLS
jgi:hypothetical protein